MRQRRFGVRQFASLPVILVAALGLAPAVQAQCPNFGAATNYPAGSLPMSVATGDFDGDGKDDVAVANYTSNNLTILLATGPGTFTPAAGSPLSVGSRPVDVAVGDFDGDQISDLAVVNTASNDVSILLGTGAGTFASAPGSPVAVGGSPTSVTIDDFDGDGHSDLAVVNLDFGNVSVLLGTGDGAFVATPGPPVATGTTPHSVATGDFDADGHRDLAVTNYGSHDVSILLGTGTGAFAAAPGSPVAAGSSPWSLAVSDFNSDGKNDLAVTDVDSSEVSIVLGAGGGTFLPATQFAVGSSPWDVAIGDFDGDGKIDLANVNHLVGVSILLGTGTGTFAAAANFVEGSPISVAVGDFDGDGRSDLAWANANGDNVSILLNAGCPPVVTAVSPSTGPTTGGTVVSITGSNFVVGGTTVTFGAGAGTSVSCSSSTQCTATSPSGSGTVSVRVATSSGTSADTASDDFSYTAAPATACAAFGAATNFPAGAQPASVATGDFNGDGKSDLAVANSGSNDVSILLATAPGTFAAAPGSPVAVGTVPLSVAVGDFNGDGQSDLAVANNHSNDVSILSGTGTGTFLAATTFEAGTNPISVAVGDFNADGRSDLAIADHGGSSVSILLGMGAGAFGAPSSVAAGSSPRSVATGDFNGDGRIDLAVADLDLGDVSVLLGTGPGTFAAAPGSPFAVGTSPYSVAVADFNGDGKRDLAVANINSNDVSILLGTGTGSFLAAANFAAGTNPDFVAAGDFNADGNIDLAVSNYTSNDVSILLGTGSGMFGPATNFTGTSGPSALAVADFNGDDRSDLAVSNNDSDNVSILLNSTAPGTLVLSAATYSAVEAAGTATITVNRTGGSDCSLTVNYAASNGTAIAGADYTATTGTLTFGAGVTTQSIAVPITNDTLNETNETFTVTLSNPSGGSSLGAPASAVVTIVDDDPAPDVTLSLTGSPMAEGGGSATVTATLSAVSTKDVTVSLGFSGTASALDDYMRSGSSIAIPAGSLTGSITLTAVQDAVDELDETIVVGATGVTNGNLATPQRVTATLADDDADPALAIDNVVVLEGSGGTTDAVFTVTLSGTTAQTVTVDYATADGTATAPEDYTAANGTLTFAPGMLTQTVTVPVVGDALNEVDETFAVGLSGAGNATISTASGSGTITDDDAVPSLAIGNASQVEANGGTASMDFTVTLSAPSGQTVTVDYATVDGTATAGSDYTATNGTLTFAPGTLTQIISVPIVGDAANEPNETFTVTLSAPVNAAISTATGTGTILNDDGAPALSIDSPSQPEGNSGTASMSFMVTLSPASGQTVTVDYATSNGTATAGSDYTATSGTLTFAPGVTTQTISVPIAGDALNESDETFTVTLSAATNAAIATAAGTGTILNDDGAPALSIDSPSQPEGNSGTAPMSFVVTLSPASGQAVTVDYATSNGTATAGGDYTATSGTLTFAPGVTTQTISVPIAGDALHESDETFTVTLSAATNAAIATAAGTGTIVNDDPAPAITAITPEVGPLTGGQTITITGTDLGGATSVTFGGIAGTITANSATSITVITPAHAAGAVDVVVTSAAGSATSAGGYLFAMAAAIPTLSEWVLLALIALLGMAGWRATS